MYDVPPVVEARHNRTTMYGGVPANSFCKANIFPSYVNNPVVSPILRLFFLRSPAAIFRRIGSININPINGVISARLLPHVFKKVWKSTFSIPSLAYRYSSPPVVSILWARNRVAPIFYASPSAVLRRHFSANHMSVFRSRLMSKLSRNLALLNPKASAALGVTAFEGISGNSETFPARANAIPHGVFGFPFRPTNYGKSAKRMSGYVNDSCHSDLPPSKALIIMVSILTLAPFLSSCTSMDSNAKRSGIAAARVNVPPLPDDCRVQEQHAVVSIDGEVIAVLKRERSALNRANARVKRCADNYDNVAKALR